MQRFLFAILVAAAVIASTYSETTCESHKRNSGTSAHGLRWNIECDENGDYKPLQCTDEERESNKWCACYNKEEAITSPSRKTRTCVCPLKADEIRSNNPNAPDCDIPKCANTGKFEEKQCCGTPPKCHCVNPETGEKTTEPSTDSNLQCP